MHRYPARHRFIDRRVLDERIQVALCAPYGSAQRIGQLFPPWPNLVKLHALNLYLLKPLAEDDMAAKVVPGARRRMRELPARLGGGARTIISFGDDADVASQQGHCGASIDFAAVELQVGFAPSAGIL